jgi:hypothetical protein
MEGLAADELVVGMKDALMGDGTHLSMSFMMWIILSNTVSIDE